METWLMTTKVLATAMEIKVVINSRKETVSAAG